MVHAVPVKHLRPRFCPGELACLLRPETIGILNGTIEFGLPVLGENLVGHNFRRGIFFFSGKQIGDVVRGGGRSHAELLGTSMCRIESGRMRRFSSALTPPAVISVTGGCVVRKDGFARRRSLSGCVLLSRVARTTDEVLQLLPYGSVFSPLLRCKNIRVKQCKANLFPRSSLGMYGEISIVPLLLRRIPPGYPSELQRRSGHSFCGRANCFILPGDHIEEQSAIDDAMYALQALRNTRREGFEANSRPEAA